MNSSQGYRLVQRLGSGVGGPVYLAERDTGKVAIREFKSASEPGSLPWEQERARFLEVGRASETLKHPRIVPVLDVIDEGVDAFIVMEYEEGETLEAALSARRFSPKEANPILRQIAIALDFAHDHAVVHGDLKPSDIFLVPRHGVKVADFGISPRARRDSRGPIPASLMHEFLSPERLRDSDPITARSDQYSLAAIAYRMYAGHAPDIQAPDGPQGATRLAEITPPSRIDPQLPPSIDGPILRALDRDPERRYDSCGDFLSALEAALIASAIGLRQRGKRLPIYAAAALILILAAAAILTSGHRGHDSTPPGGGSKAAPTPARQLPPASPAPDQATNHRPPGGPARARPLTVRKSTTLKETGRQPHVPIRQHAPPQPIVEVVTPPKVEDSRSPLPEAARGYTIEVFSRSHRIENGSSFGFNDPVLGELGLGDLRAVVNAEGRPPARGRLKLEWSVDGRAVAPPRPVALKDILEYGNEPTAGTYRLTLKLAGRQVQVFSFTITP